jgi:diguanylate cyclase (GGDEF)-like protein
MKVPVTRRDDSPVRLFATFAFIMLCAVIVLGLALAASYRAEATRRGLAQGKDEAILMAQTAVQPILNGRELSTGLSPAETVEMNELVKDAGKRGDVLRLRLRDLQGVVIYSDDGTGLGSSQNGDEARQAARGHVVSIITHLNADAQLGPLGPPAVEIYLALSAGTPSHRVGVLEVYLPYTPISRDVGAGLSTLYRNLAVGLAVLYLLLFGISFRVGRTLRQQVIINQYMAEHDALTDLPNRVLFHERAESELRRGSRRGLSTMIAIIDLDRFKEINDTLGHPNGDQLLIALSTRLVKQLGGSNAVARLGGDEFGVLLSDVDDPEFMLQRVREAIEREINIDHLPLSVEASIGFVIAPEHGTNVDTLLQLADVAMYTAKSRHLGVVKYHESQSHYNASNLALVAELRHAIDVDELVLYYQPKVRIIDGRVNAVEALVRWQHPNRGLVYPDEFIPLAEQTDLIDRLTAWVMKRALSDVSHFGPGADELTVSVNVSARNLGRAGFAASVLNSLGDAGVAPERLFVEVTETTLMTDPDRAAAVLSELDRNGVRLSIDDFGTGQTSLGYLSTLPIHEIKIDRSFITDMMERPAHTAIVHSIVELGHNLGFSVVAEGVETEAVLIDLRTTGCDVAQGYFFAKPMPAGQLGPWLTRYEAEKPIQTSP